MSKKPKKAIDKAVQAVIAVPDDGLIDTISTNYIEHKNKPGRKSLNIDPKLVYAMAKIHCSAEEIGAVLGCSRDYIFDHFGDLLREGKEVGKMSIRRQMVKQAMGGDTKMMIWLSKQYMGMKESFPEQATNQQFHIQINEVPK